MARPMHFEIQASNAPVLMDFYSQLFGWTFNKWEAGEYWMIHTGPDDQPGINGGLLPRQGPPPADMAAVNASVLTIIVDDLDATLARLTSIGGSAKVAVPKMAVPSIGWLTYIKDPDGNFFGMMQPDTSAA
jgi:predicted enzyme related to lactoylglutathione lyase